MTVFTTVTSGTGSFTFTKPGKLTLNVWGSGASGGRRSRGAGGGAFSASGVIDVAAGDILYWDVGVGPTGTITTTGDAGNQSWARLNQNNTTSMTTAQGVSAFGAAAPTAAAAPGGTTGGIGVTKFVGGNGGTFGSGTTQQGGGGGGAGLTTQGFNASGVPGGAGSVASGSIPAGGKGGNGGTLAVGNPGGVRGGGGGATADAAGIGGAGGDGQLVYGFDSTDFISNSSGGISFDITATGTLTAYATNGPNWVQTGAPLKLWTGIISSADGTRLAAWLSSDYIYTSADSGSTWTPQTDSGSRSWSQVVMSDNGMYLAAIVNGSNIYTSSDYGVTWTAQSGSGARAWSGVAMSSDGSFLAASANAGSIWTSADYGVSWTEQTGGGTRAWSGIEVTPDGSRVMATITGSASSFTSADSGVTWTTRTMPALRNWNKMSSSDDGSVIVAVSLQTFNASLSTDYGATWNDITDVGAGTWKKPVVSADGNIIILTGVGRFVNITLDRGVSWTRSTYSNWNGLAASSDGLKLVAVTGSTPGYSYKATIVPHTDLLFQGSAVPSVTLLIEGTSALSLSTAAAIHGDMPLNGETVIEIKTGAPTVISLFDHSITSPNLINDDSTAYTLGTSFVVKSDGAITGISFYRNPNDPTIFRDVALYTPDGTPVAIGISSSEPQTEGWLFVPFDEPFTVTPNTQYIAAYLQFGQHYVATSGYFNIGNGGDFEDDNFFLHSSFNSTYGNNGRYETVSSAIEMPTQSFNATNYWVDIDFIPAGSSGSVTLTGVGSLIHNAPGITTSLTASLRGSTSMSGSSSLSFSSNAAPIYYASITTLADSSENYFGFLANDELVMYPSYDGSVIYYASPTQILKSLDYGLTKEVVYDYDSSAGNWQNPADITISGDGQTIIWHMYDNDTDIEYLYISQDGLLTHSTFTPSHSFFGAPYHVNYDGSIIYEETTGSVFSKSIDTGVTWVTVINLEDEDYIGEIASADIDSTGDRIFLNVVDYINGSYVLVTHDAGATWTVAAQGDPESDENPYRPEFHCDPTGQTVVYTSFNSEYAGYRAFGSVDGGITWSALPELLDEDGFATIALALYPTLDKLYGKYIAPLTGYTLIELVDGEWIDSDFGVGDQSLHGMSISGYGNLLSYYSYENGAQAYNRYFTAGVPGIGFTPEATGYRQFVADINNHGLDQYILPVYDIQNSHSGQYIYGIDYDSVPDYNVLKRSSDGGSTFETVMSVVSNDESFSDLNVSGDGLLVVFYVYNYAASRYTAYRSLDGLVTYEETASDLDGLSIPNVISMDGSSFLVWNSAIEQSTDYGITWTPILEPTNEGNGFAFVEFSENAEVIFAQQFTEEGEEVTPIRSLDGGVTWNDFPIDLGTSIYTCGYTGQYILFERYDPDTDTNIYSISSDYGDNKTDIPEVPLSDGYGYDYFFSGPKLFSTVIVYNETLDADETVLLEFDGTEWINSSIPTPKPEDPNVTADLIWEITSVSDDQSFFAFYLGDSNRYEILRQNDGTAFSFSGAADLQLLASIIANTTLSFSTSAVQTGSGSLAGTNIPEFTLSGVLTGTTNLTAVNSVEFESSALLTLILQISGSTQLGFGYSAAIDGISRINGSDSILFATQASMKGAAKAIGTSLLSFSSDGIGNVTVPITGSAVMQISTAATLQGLSNQFGSTIFALLPVAGISAVANLSGDATLGLLATGTSAGATTLVGSSDISTSAVSTITGTVQLIGSTDVAFTTAGTIFGIAEMQALSNLSFVVGPSTILGQKTIFGTSSVSIDATASIGAYTAASGSSSILVQTSATLVGMLKASGSSSISIEPTATIKGLGSVTTSTPLTIQASATMNGSSSVSGSSTVSLQAIAVIGALARAQGSTSTTFQIEALIDGFGLINSTTGVAFDGSAIPSITKYITGSSDISVFLRGEVFNSNISRILSHLIVTLNRTGLFNITQKDLSVFGTFDIELNEAKSSSNRFNITPS